MALPETIPVKYTEEEAEYLSVRPVVRQTFRRDELLDMLLSIAGKDVGRLQQILRSGTAVFHFYRYWWPAIEASAEELGKALARFPDPDASRAFRSEDCTLAILESTAGPGRVLAETERGKASQRRWFRRQSFWQRLMEMAQSAAPDYETYSYGRRGDLYILELPPERREALIAEARRLAPRGLRRALRGLPLADRVVLVCPRVTR